jgi:hypothetical protein
MATVQSLLLQFVRSVDPYTKTGVEITSATIGTVDGDRFTKERQLDCYNRGRREAVFALSSRLSSADWSKDMSGMIVSSATITFSSGTATKPDGYIQKILLTKSNGSVVSIVRPEDYAEVSPFESASAPVVQELSSSFKASSSTIVPNGSYVLSYYGITDFTLADVTGGTVTETINERWHPLVLELAEAVANGQGSVEVNALAHALIGGK